ncbi:GNAT family N-acetyltransferase [Sphingobacterium deserti]|uniref:GNAT family N-acetyltransferase n=1 Tax=Sphingobacterium deserti TaxID=1229276 RepID=UPI0014700057|nr:GNAT family N-acetyltransferase [Sphingobacterium deserti]
MEELDAKTSYAWRNDPKIWEFTGSRPDREITEEIETEWILKALSDPTSKRFAILADDIYVGNIQLTHLNTEKPQYHIFIGDKSFWGKGVAKRATYQILYFASKVLKLTAVFLEVNNLNISAIKAYESCGFRQIEKKETGSIMSIMLDTLYKPTVSIFVMVYNHAKYLQECLDGLLIQDCDFDYEICVGEDCSLDESRVILQRYQSLYPGKFNLLLHEKNVGAVKNQNMLLDMCEGSYIAICEGDDYWTDPFKLQKQVDFLKSNNDCNLVYHRAMIYDEDDKVLVPENLGNHDVEGKRTLEELSTNGNFMHSPTVMFRNNINFSSELLSVVVGDYVLWFLNGEKGKFGFIPDYMAVYRMWNGSVWGKKSLFKQSYHWLLMLEKLINYTDSKLIRRKLIDQAVTVCERIGLTDLNANERNSFIMIVLRIKPVYIFTLFKRFIKSAF